jgi:hypothetical protein
MKKCLASNLFLVALLLLAGIRAVNLAAVQMPFNGWDELPHIAVGYYVHKFGRMPTPRTPMPRELVPFITAHPHPTTSLFMLRGIHAKPYPGGDPACGVEPPRRFDMFLYQAQHGPLYYHLMAPFLSGADPESLLAWVDGGRLVNIVLLLGTLFLWHRILRHIVPEGPLAWLPDGVLLLLTSFSYVFYNFVRFSNDALALFLGTVAMALYCLWIKPIGMEARGQVWRFAVLGGVTGLAVLAKATTLALLPVFGLVLLWQCLRRGPARSRLTALACLAAFILGYAALAGFYHLQSLSLYGQLTGMQEAVANGRRGFGLVKLLGAFGDLGYGLFRNPILYNATLHVGGWSGLASPDWINLGFKTVVTCCALALGLALVRTPSRHDAMRFLRSAPELPLLTAASALALGYHALHSALRWGFPTTGAWYGMISLPAFFLLLLLGPALCGRKASAYCLLLLTILFNFAYMDGTYNVLLTQETGVSSFYDAIKRMADHHALLRPDLHLLLVGEFACLAAVMALAVEKTLTAGTTLWRPAILYVSDPVLTLRAVPRYVGPFEPQAVPVAKTAATATTTEATRA